MGCNQAKISGKNKKQLNILSVKQQNQSEGVSTTPTFNNNIDGGMGSNRNDEIYGSDFQNFPTFRQQQNMEAQEDKIVNKKRSQSQEVVILEMKSDFKQEYQMHKAMKCRNKINKINKQIMLNEIEGSSIMKRRRNTNELIYQL